MIDYKKETIKVLMLAYAELGKIRDLPMPPEEFHAELLKAGAELTMEEFRDYVNRLCKSLSGFSQEIVDNDDISFMESNSMIEVCREAGIEWI